MRYLFNWIVLCFLVVLSFKVNAQDVNWESALSSCSRERDVSDRLAAKARAQNDGHRDSKEIIDGYRREYQSGSQLMDRLDKAILYHQNEVERYKAAVDRVRNNEAFYIGTAANLAISELNLCLVRAGLQQVRQSASSSNVQQQAPVRRENKEDSARVDVNQSIALAQQNQAKGDEQARKDRRKRNDAEYQASECLSVSDQNNPASFGSLTNSCSYKVNYTYCVYRPDPAAWSTAMDCEKQSFGSGSARAGAKGFGHMKGGEAVHWLACREPALALDGRFENGRVVGRCRVIGGQ